MVDNFSKGMIFSMTFSTNLKAITSTMMKILMNLIEMLFLEKEKKK